MTEPYGMHVRFTAKPGCGDDLEAILLQAQREPKGTHTGTAGFGRQAWEMMLPKLESLLSA